MATTPRTRRTRYHHGNLRAALIDATERLIEECGPESVTVREAARRAGVSSGAPFRHFPSRTALMTAVAEQGMARLLAEVDGALRRAPAADPMARAVAFGEAYFRWVRQNPTQFRVISARNLIDWGSSATLTRDNEVLRAAMTEILEQGRRAGIFHYRDVRRAQLAIRALVYGLVRMYVDGHFAQWDVPARTAARAMSDVFALFLHGLRGTRGVACRPGAALLGSGDAVTAPTRARAAHGHAADPARARHARARGRRRDGRG